MSKERLPRGFRNHNPLNIKKDKTKWKGLQYGQTDPVFCQFKNNVWGYRAAMVILRTYRKKYGVKTVSAIIKRWAPKSENDTNAYINSVCLSTGLKAGSIVTLEDKEKFIALIEAMAFVENGMPGDISEIEHAYSMIINN